MFYDFYSYLFVFRIGDKIQLIAISKSVASENWKYIGQVGQLIQNSGKGWWMVEIKEGNEVIKINWRGKKNMKIVYKFE